MINFHVKKFSQERPLTALALIVHANFRKINFRSRHRLRKYFYIENFQIYGILRVVQRQAAGIINRICIIPVTMTRTMLCYPYGSTSLANCRPHKLLPNLIVVHSRSYIIIIFEPASTLLQVQWMHVLVGDYTCYSPEDSI